MSTPRASLARATKSKEPISDPISKVSRNMDAAIGIYGMIAYAVAQRTREIGIRMALGAGRRTVVAMVAKNAAALAGAGIVCGVGAALAVTRLLQSMLYEVSATDAASFGGAVLLLLALGSAAACVPAWRASRIDPVSTLRYE